MLFQFRIKGIIKLNETCWVKKSFSKYAVALLLNETVTLLSKKRGLEVFLKKYLQ